MTEEKERRQPHSETSARNLKIAAFVLAGLSVVLAFAGFRLSQQAPEPTAEKAEEMPYEIVVAARDIEPGTRLGEDDIEVIPYPVMPQGSFSNRGDVLNRSNFRQVQGGEPLRRDHFLEGSLLAGQITPGYRALAVSVDETVGTGGHLQPGDRVDVLYSIRASRETGNRSLARRVLRDVKVLAYGADLPGKGEQGDGDQRRSRTAVLEIKEPDIGKLLLAENTGVLRLAAIGEDDGETGGEHFSYDDRPATMNQLTGNRPGRAPPRVYVYHGDDVETVRTVR